MAVRLVLDPSVLLAAAKPAEPAHTEAIDFLRWLCDPSRELVLEIYEPAQFLLETSAAMMRQKQHRNLHLWTFMTESTPLRIKEHLAITEADATRFITEHQRAFDNQAPFVKGGDLAYIWVARERDATLVSFDNGMLRYDGPFARVVRPAAFRRI